MVTGRCPLTDILILNDILKGLVIIIRSNANAQNQMVEILLVYKIDHNYASNLTVGDLMFF